MTKIVLLELKVPSGDFCWNHKTGEICRFFYNDIGNECKFFGWLAHSDVFTDMSDGVPKHNNCKDLKEKE